MYWRVAQRCLRLRVNLSNGSNGQCRTLTNISGQLRTRNGSSICVKSSTPSTVQTQFKSLLLPRKLVSSVLLPRLLSSQAHDHSKLWVLEKAVSLGLLAVIPAAFLCQSQALDYLLALSLVAHCHWGLEAIVIDYIRPSICGPVIPKVAIAAMWGLSIVALAGLFYLNYSDVGLSTAIKMMAKA